MKWFWIIGFWIVLGACSGGQSTEPTPEPMVEVEEDQAEPVDICANPPPHECCPGTTPDCNRCRATYETYIRSCPNAMDRRVHVPVETDMEWVGGAPPPPMEMDPDVAEKALGPQGVHFRDGVDVSKKSFITCDELEASLCCRGDSPDCLSCRSRAMNVVNECKRNGKGGIRIVHNPVMPSAGQGDPKLKKKGNLAPPGLQ